MAKVVMLRNSVRDPHATGTDWWTSGAQHPLSHVDDDGDDDIGGCVEVSLTATGTGLNIYALRPGSGINEERGYLPVKPGDRLLGIGSVKAVSISGAAFLAAGVQIDWFNDAGVYLSSSPTSPAQTNPEIGQWYRRAVVAVAPDGAAWARLRVTVAHGATDTAVARGDRMLLAKVPEGMEIDPDPNLFFSGSGYTDPDTGLWTPDPLHRRVAWEGTENASPSVMYRVPTGLWITGIWKPY